DLLFTCFGHTPTPENNNNAETGTPIGLLYCSGQRCRRDTLVGGGPGGLAGRTAAADSQHRRLAGRFWRLVCRPLPPNLSASACLHVAGGDPLLCRLGPGFWRKRTVIRLVAPCYRPSLRPVAGPDFNCHCRYDLYSWASLGISAQNVSGAPAGTCHTRSFPSCRSGTQPCK